MYLLVAVTKDGEVVMATPVSAYTQPLVCTLAAGAVLMERLSKVNGRCTRCGVIARSEELVDGRCVATIGCGADEDIQELLSLPMEVQRLKAMEMINTAMAKWGVAQTQEVATPEAKAEEDAGDVLRDW